MKGRAEESPATLTRAQQKARRRSAQALVGAYHEARLLELLEYVREGFRSLDAGEIDAFDLDDVIHHYRRSARELWKFCGVTGADAERTAGTLEILREQDELPDWWEAGRPRRRG